MELITYCFLMLSAAVPVTHPAEFQIQTCSRTVIEAHHESVGDVVLEVVGNTVMVYQHSNGSFRWVRSIQLAPRRGRR